MTIGHLHDCGWLSILASEVLKKMLIKLCVNSFTQQELEK